MTSTREHCGEMHRCGRQHLYRSSMVRPIVGPALQVKLKRVRAGELNIVSAVGTWSLLRGGSYFHTDALLGEKSFAARHDQAMLGSDVSNFLAVH